MALSTISGTTGITDATITSAKLADFAAAVDLNGVELLLDADQDTSITADTDDRIDFKIANVEHFSFSNSSGDTIVKPMVDAKDIKFQQFDGRTLLDINDGGFVGIENGATGPGAIRIFEDSDLGSNYVGLSVGNVSTAYTLVFPNADGSNGQAMVTNGSGVLSFADVSSAADDIAAGDAAINFTTTAGNITIDAQGSDTDIIFKGTDGSSDITPMTLDMSAGGDLFLTGGLIDLKNDGSAVSQIKFYCESSNAHAQTLQGAPHSAAASNVLTLPSTGGNVDLVSTASTATLTNKTLTTPVIAEIDATGDFTLDAVGDIILDADGGDFKFQDGGTEVLRISNSSSDVVIKPTVDTKDIIFQQFDGTEVARIEDNATFNVVTGKLAINGTAITSTAAELNLLDGVSGLVQADLTKLAAIDATAAEINLIDGGTARGTTAVVSGDGLLVNDGGTMRMTNIDTVASYIETLNNRPAFYAFGDGATTVANNSLTKIAVQNERVDLGGCYNHTSSNATLNSLTAPAYSFTPNVAGLYYFVGAIQLNAANYNVGLVNNLGSVGGSETYASLVYRKSDTNNGMVIVAGFANMNGTGNNVTLTAHQESGGNLTTNDAIYTTYFGGFLVAKT